MKDYILLNTETEITRYFTSDNIPLLKARMHQLNYSESFCVVCKNRSGVYHPIGSVLTPSVFVIDFKNELEIYIARYYHAIQRLPMNYDKNCKFFIPPF